MESGTDENAGVCIPLILTSVSLSLSQQDFKDRIHKQKLTQSKIKESRQQIVRARKYYDDYRVQLRAKMMRMKTREEMVSMASLANPVKKVNFVCYLSGPPSLFLTLVLV